MSIKERGEGIYEITVFRIPRDHQYSRTIFLVRISEDGHYLESISGLRFKVKNNIIRIKFEDERYLVPEDVLDELRKLGLKD